VIPFRTPDEVGRAIPDAVLHLVRQGLIAYPTETVYGLGADASNAAAVRRIFEVKGRPAAHPVIVHLADPVQLADWAREIPDAVRRLARKFWPGPLTIILKRATGVSDVVTGGQDTVALRVPAHPVAQALLKEAGVPVAAPSANRSGTISPTTPATREAVGVLRSSRSIPETVRPVSRPTTPPTTYPIAEASSTNSAVLHALSCPVSVPIW